ncbi:hypothetical protein CAPTEDRAFT_21261, partial [Capitella teleta]
MERWEAKVIALFGMFLIIFLCMILPIKVSRIITATGDKSSRILGILRCFAGGVFLGTILLHMIPETHDQIQEYLLDPRDWTFPFAELCVVGGFFFICIFERTVLTIDSKKRKQKKEQNALPTNAVLAATHADQPEGTPCPLNEVMDDAEGYTNHGFTSSHNHKQLSDEVKKEATSNGTSAQTKEELEEQAETTKTRSIVLVLALSFECIFDGLSVSLQLEERGVWNMFLAIISHEFIIAFCLGIEIVKYYSTTKVILSAFAYAMMPPVGCVIGLIITEAHLDVDLDTVELTSGLLIAIAAGIFLYCTFIGMLGEELIQDCTWEKIFATLVGCGIMCGMAAIPDPAASLHDMTTALPMTSVS